MGGGRWERGEERRSRGGVDDEEVLDGEGGGGGVGKREYFWVW